MSTTFGNIVEEIKRLSSEEKEELKLLIEKFLAEEVRKRIYRNYKRSLKELQDGKLEFTRDIQRLKDSI
ncbi:MAG: hypothetical protein HUU32_02830 [Calditrichaceae bacterium]|nr:hypothetical protein [Calditrichia bacterium]NUQ40312.1 hypothetical protein [Calditrichaceae bacterium]